MITISLCMIVKNEEAVLARCLECVRDIADEIIVVDTGSSDSTVSIARKFSCQVYDFEWQNNFSAARNYSFSKATKEYILWLDADDVIDEDNRARFLEIKQTLSSDTDAVLLPYYVAFDETGRPTFSYYRERLIRRDRGFLWQEPVHEHLVISGNIEKLDAAVYHHPQVRDQAHSYRNLQIYRDRLDAGETLSTRGLYYYARELRTHALTEEAITMYEKALLQPDIWSEDAISASAALADCYCEKNLHHKALEVLFSSFTRDLPRAEILCRVGAIYIHLNENDKAIFWYSRTLELPPPNSIGFIIQEYWGYIPHMQLCMLYDSIGKKEVAYVHHMAAKKLRPNSEAVLYNDAYFQRLYGEGQLNLQQLQK